MHRMKRKQISRLGGNGQLNPRQSQSKQSTCASSQTKDVPLSLVFSRLYNDLSNKKISSMSHPRVPVTKSKLNCKRGDSRFETIPMYMS